MARSKPLSVLIVEDNPDDSRLIEHALRQGGLEVTCQRVESEAAYLAHLEEKPDIVLSDYNLPQFSALEALALLRGRQLDIPFIIVSGSIGEEIAVDAIQQGSTDYLLKDRLGRLGQAVTRALEQKRLRSKNRETDRRKTILLAVSHALAKSRTLSDVSSKIIQAICENTALQCGEYWEIDAVEKVLRCMEFCQRSSPTDFFKFETVTRATTFACGIGLPGQVWNARKHVWIEDLASDPNFPRAPVAAEVGLHGGLGFPILINNNVRGVFAFYCADIGRADEELMEMFAGVSAQISQFVERLDAEEALLLSQKHLEHLLSACPAVIYSLQLEGDSVRPTWISDNIVRLTGYDAAATSSFDWWATHLHPEDRQRALDLLAAVTTQDSWSQEYRIRCKDGTYRWIIDNRRVFRDEGNRFGQVVGTWTDISDRKQLEEQYRQAQKLESIGQLAAGIAHEINTPIQYVGDNVAFLKNVFADLQGVLDKQQQFLDRAKSGTLDEEAIVEFEQTVTNADIGYIKEEIPHAIEQALDGVGRVAKIVRAMKEFAHPGNDGKVDSDVNRLIDNTVTVANNEWKYVADVVREFDPHLPPVPCIASEFNQVILNLIVNAAHAIGDRIKAEPGKKGVITISTRVVENSAEVRVKDTGTGIPMAARAKIFDPFFTTKPVGQGTGQGLTIAHAVIVKRHGGSLTFETEMGCGSTFIIRLPISAEKVNEVRNTSK